MVAFLFHQQVITVCLNGRFSSNLYNNLGAPLGAVLSPFLSSLHIDSLSYCHSELLKYADDFLLCYSYSKCSGQEWLDDDLHRRVTWSADDGLLINKIECVECFFYPKNISLINGKVYLESKWSGILLYIWPRTWPGPLTLILSSLNVSQSSFNLLPFIETFLSLAWPVFF